MSAGFAIYFISVTAWSDGIPQFFEQQSIDMQFGESDTYIFSSPDDVDFLEKKKRYVGEDQPVEEHSILDNDFYQDEGFRFYNNTQYSFDEVKSKYMQAQANQVTLADLSISLGYGMEFSLSRSQSIGYEYISSFPHDRGQSIRIFWKKTFK